VLKRLVYDPLSGALLDHGRTTYRPPAALADFVRARDVYCRSPICRRRAIDAELDHIVPYPNGPTSADNMAGYCPHDHHMKHAPGWQVRAHDDGGIEWITPTGHSYLDRPYDYRPDQPDPLPPPNAGEPPPPREAHHCDPPPDAHSP
jgi:HNH endonuclease